MRNVTLTYKKLCFLLIMLVSLGGANFLAINMSFFQLSLYRIVLLITISALFCGCWKYGYRGIRNSFSRYSVAFLICWLGWAIFSLGWAVDLTSWFKAVFFLGCAAACTLIFVYTMRDFNDIRICFKCFLGVGLIHSMIGVSEIISGHYFFKDELTSKALAKDRMPVSNLGAVNEFATYIFILFFITLALMQHAKTKAEKMIYTAFLYIAAVLIVFSSSRANMIALLIAVFIYLCSTKNIKVVILGAGMAVIGLGFIQLALQVDIWSVIQTKIINILKTLDFTSTKESMGIRKSLLYSGLDFIKRTCGMGVGAGNIEYWLRYKNTVDVSKIYNIHNWWAEIAVSYGVGIFTAYILFYIGLIYSSYKAKVQAHDKKLKNFYSAILSCEVGFIVASVSGSTLISAEWLWVFWSVIITMQNIGNGVCSNQNKSARKINYEN